MKKVPEYLNLVTNRHAKGREQRKEENGLAEYKKKERKKD